jgi:hypothetical protein
MSSWQLVIRISEAQKACAVAQLQYSFAAKAEHKEKELATLEIELIPNIASSMVANSAFFRATSRFILECKILGRPTFR